MESTVYANWSTEPNDGSVQHRFVRPAPTVHVPFLPQLNSPELSLPAKTPVARSDATHTANRRARMIRVGIIFLVLTAA